MLRFTEILRTLELTWPEQPHHVRVLAARYYFGSDTAEDLRRLADPDRGWRGKTVLTKDQVAHIIRMR